MGDDPQVEELYMALNLPNLKDMAGVWEAFLEDVVRLFVPFSTTRVTLTEREEQQLLDFNKMNLDNLSKEGEGNLVERFLLTVHQTVHDTVEKHLSNRRQESLTHDAGSGL